MSRNESTLEGRTWVWTRKDNGRTGVCVDAAQAENLRQHGELFEVVEFVSLSAVLRYLRGSDSDDHEYEAWRRTIADDIEREFSDA